MLFFYAFFLFFYHSIPPLKVQSQKTKRIIEKNEKDLKAAQKLIEECDNTIKRVDKLLAEIRRERLQKDKNA